MAKRYYIALAIIIVCLSICTGTAQSLRAQIVALASSQIGYSETSVNSGPEVDLYIRSTGLKPPIKWCGAFAYYIYDSCGTATPVFPARATNWFPKNRIIPSDYALPASSIGMVQKGNVYHVGISSRSVDNYSITMISGNYNNQVSLDRIPVTQNLVFSDWVDEPPTFYTVRQDDTIYRISTIYKVSIPQIMKMNNLKNYRIQIGQRLRLNVG